MDYNFPQIGCCFLSFAESGIIQKLRITEAEASVDIEERNVGACISFSKLGANATYSVSIPRMRQDAARRLNWKNYRTRSVR